MDYKALLGPDGTENNMAGTEQFFYLAGRSAIKTFGKPAANPADPDDAYVITTPHVMQQGKQFVPIYCTIDTAELDEGMQGEIDGRSFKKTFKCFIPGSKKDVLSLLNRAKGDQLILIVPLADGTLKQLGGEKFSAYMTGSFKSDKTTGRGKGYEFEFMAYEPVATIYAAAVPLTPGV